MSTQVRVRVQAGIAAGLPAPGPVVSVAGRTGAVVLDVSDVTGLSASLAGKAPINSPTFTGTVSGITASMVGAPSGSGTSSGTNTGDETETRIGTLIAAAADKATPVDADSLALSDSAAASVLKKLTWSNFKAALNGVFARLAGVSGGQTLIGGTASGESLTLQSTAHATRGKVLFGVGAAYDETTTRLGVGTQSPAAELHAIATTEQLRIGYDTSNYMTATVNSAGATTLATTGNPIALQAANTGVATQGSNLITNGSFANDLSGWTDSGATWSWSSGAALHTAGSVSTLSQGITVTSGLTYQVEVTISGRTAGSVSVSVGSASVVFFGSSTISTVSFKKSVVAADTGTVSFAVTPSSSFDGKIDDVSCKQVTLGSAYPVLTTKDGSAATRLEIRHGTTSYSNLGIGIDCLRSVTVGNNNVAVGTNSCYNLTTGGENSAYGRAALYGLTVGYDNTAIGRESLYSLTTGQENTAVGLRSLYNATTMGLISALGHNAGRYLADGSTAATSATASLYVGAATKLSANSVTNENVFGYNATGIGSNSCVIGSSAVTKCQLYGDIILDKTVTASGTTGAQTINKTVGSVNFAAGASSLVVTNSRVTTASVIIATVATNDTTLKSVVAVAGSGSFTLTANAAATAETRVNFIVIN